jgi:hypothetical protein
LEWNSIGLWDDAMRSIGDALSVTNSLKELDLRNNKIGPSGLEALSSGLRANRSILCLGKVFLD